MGVEGHDIRADVRPLGGIAPYGIQMFAHLEESFLRSTLRLSGMPRQFYRKTLHGKPGLPDFENTLREIQI